MNCLTLFHIAPGIKNYIFVAISRKFLSQTNSNFRATVGQTRKCVPQNKKCTFSKGVPDKSWHNLGLRNMSLLAKWMSDQRTQCRFSELKNIKNTWKKQFWKSWYFRSKSWHIFVQKPQIEKRVLDSDLAGLIHSSTRGGGGSDYPPLDYFTTHRFSDGDSSQLAL